MPYFQRTRLSTPPPSGNGSNAERSGASIVDRAAAILDKEVGANVASPATSPFDGLGIGRSPSMGLLDIGDIQKRANDVLADLLKLFSQPEQLAKLAQPDQPAQDKFVSNAVPMAMRVPKVTASVCVIEPQRPVKAGSTTTIAVKVANDGADPAHCIFYSTDFISDSGHEIPSLQVTFSPRTLALSVRSTGKTDMQVTIPAQSAPGTYSALVQASGLTGPQAVVILRVE